ARARAHRCGRQRRRNPGLFQRALRRLRPLPPAMGRTDLGAVGGAIPAAGGRADGRAGAPPSTGGRGLGAGAGGRRPVTIPSPCSSSTGGAVVPKKPFRPAPIIQTSPQSALTG